MEKRLLLCFYRCLSLSLFLFFVSTFFFHFHCLAFRSWLSVPKHNLFFCYSLKVNFLHFSFVSAFPTSTKSSCRVRSERNTPKCTRIYNIVDSIFLRTRTVKLNGWDMFRFTTGFCVFFLLPCRILHTAQFN